MGQGETWRRLLQAVVDAGREYRTARAAVMGAHGSDAPKREAYRLALERLTRAEARWELYLATTGPASSVSQTI